MSENSNTKNKIQMNAKTAAQLLAIIKNSDQEVMNRIPPGFIRFLEIETKDVKEEVINFENPSWEDELEEETQVYLALIYRDYIVTPEQRKELIEEEKRLRKLQSLNERYSTNEVTQQTQQINTNYTNTNQTEQQPNYTDNTDNTENTNNIEGQEQENLNQEPINQEGNQENQNNQENQENQENEENKEESTEIIETGEKLNWFQKLLKKILRL